MNTLLELRHEIHNYVDHADERVIRMIYGMLQADVEEDYVLTDEQKKFLDERIDEYYNNPNDAISLEDFKKNIEAKTRL